MNKAPWWTQRERHIKLSHRKIDLGLSEKSFILVLLLVLGKYDKTQVNIPRQGGGKSGTINKPGIT